MDNGSQAGLAALGRIGTPEDIADMVGLLVDSQAGWVTGQNNILVNGGFAGLMDCLMNETERKKQCINYSVCSW